MLLPYHRFAEARPSPLQNLESKLEPRGGGSGQAPQKHKGTVAVSCNHERVFQAMLQMTRIDFEGLQQHIGLNGRSE
jgi:hypothetical protein